MVCPGFYYVIGIGGSCIRLKTAQFFKVLGVGFKTEKVTIEANGSYGIRYYNALIAINSSNAGYCDGIGVFGKGTAKVNWLIPKTDEITVTRDQWSSITTISSTVQVTLYIIPFNAGGY